MKNTLIVFVLFISAAIALNSCKKKEEAIVQTELEKLPEATQVGANTFGALVNGQAFIPYSSAIFGSTYQCNYIYTNGGYYFFVGASNSTVVNSIYNVTLSTNNLPIALGQTIKLENRNELGKACGLYGYLIGTSNTTYQTTSIVNGNLYISHFDQINHVVSGTFFFKAVNLSTGDTVRVTDGRFDMKYTM